MSFGEVLKSSVSFAFDANGEDLHPYALQVQTSARPDATRASLQQKFCELPFAYQRLAWAYIGTTAEALQSEEAAELSERHEKLLDASTAGTATMLRYLSMLPGVYASYRSKFPEVPATVPDQALELGRIALRSEGVIHTMAGETPAVNGVLERNQRLRGSISGNPETYLEQIAWNFEMVEEAGGMLIKARQDLQYQVDALRASFRQDVEKGRTPDQKRVGCMALRVAQPSYGDVFSALWHRFITIASMNAPFFEQDLRDIAELKAPLEFAE